MLKEIVNPKFWFLKHGLKPKKLLGQNFLINIGNLIDISYAVSDFCKSNTLVIEYGAGIGALTYHLLKQNLKVHAVEIEQNFIFYLNKYFAMDIVHKNLFIHKDNAKKFNFLALCKKNENIVLCGNLPYYLSGALIGRAIEYYSKINGAVFLLQKELVDRLIANHNCKNYGVLSVLLQMRFSLKKICDVPREAFWPIPSVNSSIIVLSAKKDIINKNIDWLFFKNIVKTAFSKRRKSIKNSLNSFPNIEIVIKELNWEKNLRAENLSVKNFVDLSNKLLNNKIIL